MKKRNRLIVPLLVLGLTFLMATSCEENSLFNPSSFDDEVFVNIHAADVDYTPLYEYSRENSTYWDRNNTFSSASSMYVYAKQDGKITDHQICSATLSTNSQDITCKYNEMKKINTSKPYDLYLSFTKLEQKNNTLYTKAQLTRSSGYYAPIKASNAKSGQTVNCYTKGVVELTVILNKTHKPITFVHKGFKADDLWYYESALLSLDDNSAIEGKAVTTDVKSEKITVSPRYENKRGFIHSYYPPNGKKIKNATLVAEIDGKEVRTSNTLSSDFTLTSGKAYSYTLEWDGKELRFVQDYKQLDESLSNRDMVVNVETNTSLYTPLYDIVSYDLNNLFSSSTFNEGTKTRKVYAKQDGVWMDCGDCTASLNEDRTVVQVKYNEKGYINTTVPHQIALVGGYSYVINGDLYYKCELMRGTSHYSSATGTIVLGGETLTSEKNGVGERTFLINTSGSEIKFKHKGFDTSNKWYYQSALVNIESKKAIGGVQVEKECISDSIIAPPLSDKKWKYLYSYYVPNGRKINNTRLVAEIDGKEVKTANTLSSDVALELGSEYYYVLQWDGKELKFVSDEKGNTPSNVKLRAMPKEAEAKKHFVPFSTE